MYLSKTDYLHSLSCIKSLWLMKNKPVIYPQSDKSTYEDKLSVEGYEVQKLVEEFLQSTEHKSSFSFEQTFSTDDGLYAVADIVRKKC